MPACKQYTVWFLALMVVLTALAAGRAQAAHAELYYTGTLAAQPVQTDISFKNAAIHGTCAYDTDGRETKLKGTLARGGAAAVTETDAKGAKTGALTGTFTADRRTFSGTWHSADGRKSAPFKLTAVAEYLTLLRQQKFITATGSYPSFFAAAPAFATISSHMRNSIATAQQKFLQEARANQRVLPRGMTLSAEYHFAIKYYAHNLVSLLETHIEYPGGAHPNTTYISYNVQMVNGKPTPFTLSDLFQPGSPCVSALSDYILTNLRHRGADWVTNGQLTSFKASDLSTFYLRPTSITFVFDPYAVGPYVQGAFFVLVPYTHVCANINPNGPLGLFMMTKP